MRPLNWLSSALLLATTAAAATITITQSAAPTPTSPSYTSDTTFQKDVLAAHNFYRGEHNASALVWNSTSAATASKWAAGCAFKHSVLSLPFSPFPHIFLESSRNEVSNGGPTGENLSAGYANASASIDVWGLERTLYNFDKPGFSEATGHFTQLVWSNTSSV
ncbi:Repressed by EFG1 protein, partial [Lachnellula suecica]